MANKAHIWSKNDKITAERLNTMSKTINSLVDGGISSDDNHDKPHGDSDTANWQTAIDDAQPVIHEWANHVGYRHPVYGTADLYDANLPIGMYATSPAIIDANGKIARDITHFGCMPCYLSGGECAQMVYVKYATSRTGELLAGSNSAQYVVGSAYCSSWYGLNAGTGVFYHPIARIGKDPKFECQMQAMHFNPVQIPLKADNAAYLPTYDGNGRGVQGMIFADPPQGNIVPIRGLNNHGGVKIMPQYDNDGQRRSNAVMASPEIYGKATQDEYNLAAGSGIYKSNQTYFANGPQIGGSGASCGPTCAYYFRQAYNSMYPFASGDGGVLAKWPIIQQYYDYIGCGKNRTTVVGTQFLGEISLIGGHVGANDWQLWFQGCGKIVLPPTAFGSAYVPGPLVVGS